MGAGPCPPPVGSTGRQETQAPPSTSGEKMPPNPAPRLGEVTPTRSDGATSDDSTRQRKHLNPRKRKAGRKHPRGDETEPNSAKSGPVRGYGPSRGRTQGRAGRDHSDLRARRSDRPCDCCAAFALFSWNERPSRVRLSCLTSPHSKAVSQHTANWVKVTGTKTLIFFFFKCSFRNQPPC